MTDAGTRLALTDGHQSPVHPGWHIRNTILLPKKLKVKKAAQLIGVGTPALSNFLNGKAATTPEMAERIERSFGVPASALLEMQAAYDAAEAKAKGAPANAIPYVVPFLGIKAVEIERWVDRNVASRAKLAVLLRTLVNSTGQELTKVDFPGNDDAERAGWDGFVEAVHGTPWIPQGASGWEFGTNQDIKKKADGDFAKAVNATDRSERGQTSFVFATPRHWPGKRKWAQEMGAKALWREVRAYDSSDLEQWLEQSLPAQVWFNSETERPKDGVRSLDWVWADWADVADPALAASFFATVVEREKKNLRRWLEEPRNAPIVIAADSTGEGLAFLAQAVGGLCDDLAKYRDQVLVFDKPGVLPRLAQGAKSFVAVTANREVERELGPLARSIRSIIVYPRNATTAIPDIVLEPLNYETFRAGLEAMEYDRDAITKYENESGRSLTVLRRRLSNVEAVRAPAWAADREIAAKLIPFLFVGAWSSINAADQTALSLLSNGRDYDALESDCQRLAALDDPPLWSVGPYRGAVSKIDLLYAIVGSVTAPHLKRYFDLAAIVLGEDDPKLDLPEAERWAAAVHGKRREFSGALRTGVAETLVLLAVHGDHLFGARFDCEMAANRLVRALLTPLKTRLLEANEPDLPAYAEAAPNEFLSILEEDLRRDEPTLHGLMRPADSLPFGGCPRSGLLWALEGLAWNPASLPRVALILAQLAEIEINDNWGNKPFSSLNSIFRVWMPQTAADHQTRLRVMGLLAQRYPNVAWRICIEQLDTDQRVGHYSHKPRWRNDGYGYGEPHKTWGPIREFMREMADLALAWKGGHSKEMLCDLIGRLQSLDDADQAKVWELMASWAADASDADKALVREKIRVTVLSRRAARHAPESTLPKLSRPAKAAYEALKPSDLLARHEWLFRQHWVEESADELNGGEFDFHMRDARISELRVAALREVFKERGAAGILELAEMGEAAGAIGFFMASDVLAEDEIAGFLLSALPPASNSESRKKRVLLRGVLEGIRDERRRVTMLKALKKELAAPDFVRLLMLAPFRRGTWRLVDKLKENDRQIYWQGVEPDWIRESDEETNEAVERLLASQRPRAAFACAHFKLESIEVARLFRLMSEIAKGGDEQPGHYQLEPYYIEKATRILDKTPMLTLDEKAGLEFAYIDALSQPGREDKTHGIQNLEKYIEQHPEFFARAVAWIYKRHGSGGDPPEWKIPPEQVQLFAERGYKLLDALRRTPGHDEDGKLTVDRLAAWVKAAREACAGLGRAEMGDHRIGQLLSHAPVGGDGVWPCEPVRAVMENARSDALMEGAWVGVLNSRGVVWRGVGGDQERELANKYRDWAIELQFSHPYVASALLGKIADAYDREAKQEDTEAGIRRRLM